MAYDALGRLTTRKDAAGGTEAYSYDRVGNRLAQTVGGATTTWAYDTLNRVTDVMAGDVAISYAYDAAGRRTAMTDATGTTRYVYDDLGRPVGIMAPDMRTASLAYDAVGNLTTVTDYGGKSSTRTYDRRNRLGSVMAADATTTSYSYDAGDLLLSTAYPNGFITSNGYDGAGRLTSLVNRRPDGTVHSSYTYACDALGRKVSVQDEVGLTSYLYDANDRLQRVSDADGSVTEYTFDGAGNRLTQVLTPGEGAAQTTRYAYDAADRLTQVTQPDGRVAYAYDARGNLTDDGTYAYTYDGLNRLTTVAQDGAPIASYMYNGDDLRVGKRVGSQSTSYYWIGQHVWNEGDGAGITAANLYGTGLVRRDVGGQAGYYLFNGHQDVTGMVDRSGAELASYRYDAYGSPVKAEGAFDNPFRYTGEMRDEETGLIYLRARYYQPGIGRFLTQDTWKGDPRTPWTLNLSVYVRNNPVNYVDPTGHVPVRIELNTFIPFRDVTFIPGLVDFSGDNRGPGEPGTFRTRQVITVDAETGTFESNRQVGITHATIRWIGDFPDKASGDTLKATASFEDGFARVRLRGNEGNPFVPGAPGITYDFTFTIGAQGSVYVEGKHDGFPGYEVLLDGALKWSFDPRQTGEGLGSLFPPAEHRVNKWLPGNDPAPFCVDGVCAY